MRWSQERQRGCSSLCLCWLGRDSSSSRSRNIRRGTEILLREQKRGARQGAEADLPLEEERWGTASPKPHKVNFHPVNDGEMEDPLLSPSCFIGGPFVPVKDGCTFSQPTHDCFDLGNKTP